MLLVLRLRFLFAIAYEYSLGCVEYLKLVEGNLMLLWFGACSVVHSVGSKVSNISNERNFVAQ